MNSINPTTILELIRQKTLAAPYKTAIIFNKEMLTYLELEQKTNQLSNYLVEHGITKGSIVGVYMERSIEMIITLIGIMKAGAAYLPLDDSNPIERNRFIIANSDITLLITQSKFKNKLNTIEEQLLYIDANLQTIKSYPDQESKQVVNGDDTAYILYTSGSTGAPKGVVISHAGVANILEFIQKETQFDNDDRLLAVATYTFDMSVLDFFLPLISGATLIIADSKTAFDGNKLNDTLETEKITAMQATPATWRMLIDSGWKGNKSFKIFCGGEAWTRQLANHLLDRCGSLWNFYGPTETTIYSIINRIEPGDSNITLGSVVSNTKIYLLDENMNQVPKGEIGELYIGGIGLAKGYLNNTDLTNERFIYHSFPKENNCRIYKTGDLVKYNQDGELEYIGRADFQVKIRGFRIELEEIEKLAEKHPKVNQAVAHVISGEEQEDKRIILFYTAQQQFEELENELTGIFESKLPYYMVPTTYIHIESLPLTFNGKIDRKELEKQYPIHLAFSNSTHIAPSTDFEQKICEVWTDLLEIDMISVHDNFLELGGHSLMANRLTSRINSMFGTNLTLLDILTNEMTISSQASLVENNLISQFSQDDMENLLKQMEELSDAEKEELLMM